MSINEYLGCAGRYLRNEQDLCDESGGEFKYTLVSENVTEDTSSSMRLICGSKEIVIKLVVCSAVWLAIYWFTME